MENWGLVTYRTTAVLFEEGKSDEKYRNRVAYVVAHGMFFFFFFFPGSPYPHIHILLIKA